jgi:hypothetical protein
VIINNVQNNSLKIQNNGIELPVDYVIASIALLFLISKPNRNQHY